MLAATWSGACSGFGDRGAGGMGHNEREFATAGSGSGAMMIERTLRRWLMVAVAATAWVSLPAHAQYDYRGVRPAAQQGGPRGDGPDFRSDRDNRSREASQGRQAERDRGTSLTPDERRDLNRDLQRANREFYRKGREGR